MAQLITTYSKELKEKIFVLKGEESYARTTDTLLDEILHDGERREDWNAHKEYMLLEFRIDVLRDLGASDIVLYDNDEILGVYPFELGTHSIEFKYTSPTNDTRLKLRYGEEHNIYARYMGNKQCLKSTSRSYSFYEPIPSKFDSSIALTGLKTNYGSGDTVSFTPTITAYSVENLELIVYLDGVENQKVRTDATGKAPVSLTGLSDGKHTISVAFLGGDYSTATSTTIDISVGYLVRMTEYPSYIINQQPATVKVYAYDYLDKPASDLGVVIAEYIDGWGWETISQDKTTDSNGYATLNPVYITDKKFKAVSGTYESEELTIPYYGNVTISSLTASPTLISTNYSSTISGTVSNVSSPVVVSLNQEVGEVTTGNTGNFTATYKGRSSGDTTITASVYKASNTVKVEDVVEYWKAPSNMMNRQSQLGRGSIIQQSNGWLLTADQTGKFYMDSKLSDEDIRISFKVISQTGVTNMGGIFSDSPVITASAGDVFYLEYYNDGNVRNCGIAKNPVEGQKGVDYIYEDVGAVSYLGFTGNANCKLIIDEFKVKRI